RIRGGGLLKRRAGTLKSSILTRNIYLRSKTCSPIKTPFITPLHSLTGYRVSLDQSVHSHRLAGPTRRLFQAQAGYLLAALLTHHSHPEPRPSYRSVCQALVLLPSRVQA